MLNAFRHQRENHTHSPYPPIPYSVVLNAFRHQRENHRTIEFLAVCISSVLNAFRHQRENHAVMFCLWELRIGRAQRLSASEGKSQDVRGIIATDARCSTPFGIRGKITASGLVQSRGSPCCAQRLSASEGKSHQVLAYFFLTSARAQRLSASEGKSRGIVFFL